MRVLVNRYAALGRKTGVGHYTTELLRCLYQHAPDQIGVTPPGWLFQAEQAWARLRPILRPDAGPRDAGPAAGPSRPLPLWKRVWRDALHYGRDSLTRYVCSTAERSDYDLYHEPNHIPLPIGLPTVVTVCDLSVLLHPEWHPADRVIHFEREFTAGLERCQHVIAISEFARQEIIRTLGLSPSQVTCTYMGIRPGLKPLTPQEAAPDLRSLGLPAEGYLLYLGTLEPRKNLLTLLRAYCGLPGPLRRRWPLVLVGPWGWKAGPIADFLSRHGRSRGVIHLGYVAERQLAALYNGARALVYPSLYEGFGLPPVEMLACGGAVLASTAGALAEVVGGQAHLIAPEDEDGWREAMARVLGDDDWWQWLRQGAEAAARPYSWERCALDTLAVYRNLVGGRVPQRVAG